jgi:enamine deaminase RidA (YjgF/YER057c/UK114 family)
MTNDKCTEKVKMSDQQMEILQPEHWMRPRGYANGIAATGRTVCVSGMIGWDAQGQFHTDDFAAQTRQALQNIVEVLAEAHAKPEHIVRMTWYVLDKKENVVAYKMIGIAYREIILDSSVDRSISVTSQ